MAFSKVLDGILYQPIIETSSPRILPMRSIYKVIAPTFLALPLLMAGSLLSTASVPQGTVPPVKAESSPSEDSHQVVPQPTAPVLEILVADPPPQGPYVTFGLPTVT